jgi:hypothetical protein
MYTPNPYIFFEFKSFWMFPYTGRFGNWDIHWQIWQDFLA